ncbi:MAG: hypothetical protein Q8Q06_01415 [bacterium]|nr:hypothetical protein [bacterium]
MNNKKIFLIITLALTLLPQKSMASIGSPIIQKAASTFLNTFPAWISLAGAMTVLVLAHKYMHGGQLAKPFQLIGIGVFIDAMTQIFSSFVSAGAITAPPFYSETMIVVGLVFRLSVVIGVIWIAGIFGVLRQK